MKKRNSLKQNLNVILLNSIERSSVLLSTFQGGYTKEWYFKLPPTFRSALDIKLTTRQIDNQKYEIWTQGNIYSFKQGDTFYDSLLAYSLTWEQALKVFKFNIQIEEAEPDRYEAIETSKIHSDGQEINLILNHHVDGFVRFKVYKSENGQLNLLDTVKCSQKEFIQLLQTGKLLQNHAGLLELSNFTSNVSNIRRTSSGE